MSYEDTLYPLQDKILKIIDNAGVDFYLTGGTALSRCYFGHRYSDDIDLFVNSDQGFQEKVKSILSALSGFDFVRTINARDIVSIIIQDLLKVDFINDVGVRIGENVRHALFSRVDNLDNILANKLSAIIGRDDPKDVIDIWIIAQNGNSDWKSIFRNAGSKAEGIFPPSVCERLDSFPVEWIGGKIKKYREVLGAVRGMLCSRSIILSIIIEIH
jgi:hypothetical protein